MSPIALRITALLLLAAATAAPQEMSRRERRNSGDGRGLATFGDRGLATFGDRITEGFGRRGLERFGDTPLVPMGGLDVSGGPTLNEDSRAERRHRWPRRVRRFDNTWTGGWSQALQSHATIRGQSIDVAELVAATFILPPVDAPSLTLDHRPALAAIGEWLDDAARRADAAGDVDLAGSLSRAR